MHSAFALLAAFVPSSSGASTAPASSSLDAPGASLYLRPTSAEKPLAIRTPTMSGVFKVAQVADPHLGYTADKDAHTHELLGNLLDWEEPVSLAVLSGDQIHGSHIEQNASKVWGELTGQLSARGIPHTAVLGNHDAEPYLEPELRDVIMPEDEYRAWQGGPGANWSREELMAMDSAELLSRSSVAPRTLEPAVSTFVVDVLPPTGSRPLLSVFHIDTGGGGALQEVHFDQVQWLSGQLARRREAYGTPAPPVIAFQHIPLASFDQAWEAGDCTGSKTEEVSPPYEALEVAPNGTEALRSLTHVLTEAPEVVALFSGHDHGNDFCCRHGTLHFCYGRKTGLGSNILEHMLGMRMVDLSFSPSGWSLSTRIRERNGSVVQHKLLGAGSPSARFK